MRLRINCILLLCCTVLSGVWAQVGSEKRKRVPLGDSSRVRYYQLKDWGKFNYIDSTLENFGESRPFWNAVSVEEQDLGLLGSARYPLEWKMQRLSGYRTGLTAYDTYRLRREEVKYYEISSKKPFTDIRYSQVSTARAFIRAELAHRLNERLYFGVQYSLINQTGFFAEQRTRDQNVCFNLRYLSPKGKYSAYLSFNHFSLKEKNNWGLGQDSLLNTANDLLLNIRVNSASAQSNYKLTELAFQHFYFNRSANEAGRHGQSSTAVEHLFSYEQNRYKYFDTAPSSTFYPNNLLLNTRGVRFFHRVQKVENELAYRQALGKSFQTAFLQFRAFIKHRYFRILHEPNTIDMHNLHVGGSIESNSAKRLQFEAEGEAVWRQGGLDFNAEGQLQVDFKSWGRLKGFALLQFTQNAFLAQELYLSQDLIWKQDLGGMRQFSFGGAYALGPIGGKRYTGSLDLEFYNHTVDQLAYLQWNKGLDSVWMQNSGIANWVQVKLRQNNHLGIIHLDNEVLWQQELKESAAINFPQLMVKHNLYAQFPMFKKALELKVGAAVQYWTAFYNPYYIPVLGQFAQQSELTLQTEPIVDAYMAFKIHQFRFFLRAENLLAISRAEHLFVAPNYARNNFLMRLGISWRLFD